VACAAGLATLDIYKDEGLLTRGASLAGYWGDALHQLKGLPNVIDIRNEGLMGAVEIAPRAPDAVGARGYDVMVDCFNRGLYLRMSGDSLCDVAAPDRREEPYRRYGLDPRRRHQARGLILALTAVSDTLPSSNDAAAARIEGS
jgi:hypothetical protein